MKNLINRLVWLIFSCLLLSCILLIIFMPIFTTNTLIFPYALTPFDICEKYPNIWILIKKLYWICFFISYFIVYNFLYNNIQKHLQNNKRKSVSKNTSYNLIPDSSLKLLVGTDFAQKSIYISEKGLYQNILITGTIGTRKNFFCNVPFCRTINW